MARSADPTPPQSEAPAHKPAGITLVVAAWEPELARLRLILSEQPALRPHVLTATIGVGLVESAIGTTRALMQHSPARLVLVGTCGAFSDTRSDRGAGRSPRPALKVGRAVVIRQAHLGAVAEARSLSYFPEALPAMLEPAPALGNEIQEQAGIADAVAVCPLAITCDSLAGQDLAQKTGATVETLETFAVGRAATLAGVPFAAVVGIANVVGPRAHSQWARHGETAAAAACEAVATWLSKIHDLDALTTAPLAKAPAPPTAKPPTRTKTTRK